MNKLYLRITLLIGFIVSLIMIIFGWTITRQMVNLRYDYHKLLWGQNFNPTFIMLFEADYINNQYVNTITIGNFMIVLGVILIIIFFIILLKAEKKAIDRL